jgi:3',5'-cyclic AMP phosphodiesterase CpdA
MMHLAHLSDLHLLEAGHADRKGLERRRLAYLSAGRSHDATDRRHRALRALRAARSSGADHVLVTGDLTEDGIDAQFEVLAEVLLESGLPSEQVTLLPGNHDVYAAPDAFARALRGPLAAYAATSTPGVPLVLGDVVVLPLSTAMPQPYQFSAGAIERPEMESAATLAKDEMRLRRAMVLAMHHPPRRHAVGLWHWIDGLRDHAALSALLAQHDHLHVVHGHTHEASEHGVRPGAAPRIFGTDAVVTGEAPVRFYHAEHGRLWPVAAPTWIGVSVA